MMNRTAYARSVLRRWAASGLSMKAFAAREGIAYSTFRLWRSQARLDQDRSRELVPVDVVLDDVRAASIEIGGTHEDRIEPIEIHTKDGLMIKVPHSVGHDTLRTLLGVLRGC